MRICKTSGWEIGEVWEPDPVHACLNITPAWYAVSSELQGFREKSEKYTFAFGQGLPGLAYDTQKPVWMFNIQSNRQFLRGAEAQDFKLNTAVGFPVLAADEVVNVMVFFSREKREEEENLMNIFSGMGLQLGEFFRRKLAEEQTRMLNEDLEQRVEVRTQQLEAANKELEAFTYSVSHDLRAPLRAITGFSQILAADYDLVLDEEAKRLLGIVKSNAKEMDKLITDLLAFSRIGKGALRKTVVDMKAMALKVFDEVARSNNSVIALRINDLPEVCVDSALMLQVWRNLLSNAVKFSLAGPDPIIEIEGYEKKNELVYVVRDNGVGFDDQYKEKIFQVFQRLHRHDEFEGTGVGLAIVQRVIHRHEGRVWAEGIPGEGACFWFALPKNS